MKKPNPMLTYILESIHDCPDCPVYQETIECRDKKGELLCEKNIHDHFEMLAKKGLDHFEYIQEQVRKERELEQEWKCKK